MKLRHQYWIVICLLLAGVFGSMSGQQRQAAVSASFVKVQGEATVAGYLAKPAVGSRLPAILLVPGTSKLAGTVLQAARDMAARGFVVLAIDYDPDGVSQESDLVRSVMDEQLARRLSAGADWLALQRPTVDPQRVGAVGWGEGVGRVMNLLQQGQIGAAVVVEDSPCRKPEVLPAASGARILIIVGGCTSEQRQELMQDGRIRALEASMDSFPLHAEQVWSEMYKFLQATSPSVSNAGQPAPSSSMIAVATIRDIMRVINSDDGVRGKLARLLAPSTDAEVQWEQARSHAAIMVDSCEWLLAKPPPKGSLTGWRGHVGDYKAATQALLRAVERHDLPSAQQALGRLPQSCGSCHMDHR